MQSIDIARDAGVVTITLNRPQKKNAADLAMWDELFQAFSEIRVSKEDRVVVLTGAGGDFCAGADLADALTLEGQYLPFMRNVGEVCLALHRLPQPTIAKVRGVAIGAGVNIALGCDLVVATPEARFSEIFAQRGLALDFGGSWVLPRLVGMRRAKELALFGDIFGAADAERFGLISRVVADDEIDEFVAAWAARLAAGPPIALSITKRLLEQSYESTLEQALDAEAVAQTFCFGSEDAKEAMQAFLDKRQPVFRGR
jgi:2-(1,2-epoxy-1,2-dihydrophenyl)acetyl-CoA isomerase